MPSDLPDEAAIYAALPNLTAVTLLERGGQKIVFRATHADFGDVVLKLILAAGDDRAIREIEAVSTNRFANVPAIFDVGLIHHGMRETIYLIEQYITGETLRSMLTTSNRLPLSTTFIVLRDLLAIAIELEQCKLVHRDIKPDNIMLDEQGKLWLLDFGIARHLDKASITATVAPFGPATLGYAAPEQLRNRKGQLDIRADLFSIGVVTYECLTGGHPFVSGASDRFDVIRRTEHLDPPRLVIPGDTQRLLSGFVHHLMAKQVSRRPATARQAMDWLSVLAPTIQGIALSGSP